MYKLIENTAKEFPMIEMYHKTDYTRLIIFNIIDDFTNEIITKKIDVSFLSCDSKAKKELKIKNAITFYMINLNEVA